MLSLFSVGPCLLLSYGKKNVYLRGPEWELFEEVGHNRLERDKARYERQTMNKIELSREAIAEDNLPFLSYIINTFKQNPELLQMDSSPMLFSAALYGRPKVIKLFNTFGLDKKVYNNQAIKAASQVGSLSSLIILLKDGYSLEGCLKNASEQGHESVVKLLLFYGAKIEDINLKAERVKRFRRLDFLSLPEDKIKERIGKFNRFLHIRDLLKQT